jgi:hypothetical protein
MKPLRPRAVRAAQELARSFGLIVDDPTILAEGCAVRVHLRPAPVVARVSTLTALLRQPVDVWLRREVEVAGFLAQRGAPVVAPSDLLTAGPHWRDGFCVSFWSYVKPRQSEPPSIAVAASMLHELRRTLREYPRELLLLAPPLSDIPSSLVRMEAQRAISEDDLGLLRCAFARLSSRLTPEALGPLQPLHGDAHIYNMIASERGWLWNDFEDVCLGPVAWDLASMSLDDTGLEAYPNAPAPASMAFFREVRRLHGVCWWYALKAELPAWEPYILPMLEGIRQAEAQE